MNLSQDIIFYSINQKYKARWHNRRDGRLLVGRPMFYKAGHLSTDSLIIIDLHELQTLFDKREYTNSLFICTSEEGNILYERDCSVIVMEDEVSQGALLNLLQSIFNTYDRWDKQLKEICANGGSLKELVDCCDLIFNDPLSIVDKEFHYIAFSNSCVSSGLAKNSTNEDNNIPLDSIREFNADSGFTDLYELRSAFDYPKNTRSGILKNIIIDDEYIGRIAIKPADTRMATFKYYSAVLDNFSKYVEDVYFRYQSFYYDKNKYSPLRNMLWEAIDGGELSKDIWNYICTSCGWDTCAKFQLVQFRPNLRYDKNTYTDYFGTEIERRWRGCIYFSYNDNLLLLVNSEKFSDEKGLDFNQTLAYFLRDNLMIAGISRAFTDISGLGQAFKQTEISLSLGPKRAPTKWCFNFNELALDFVLHNASEFFEPGMICSEKLLRLQKHDSCKNTEYYKTLYVYFSCKFNAAEAAKRLCIHRSSFLSRMSRIKELVNIDFESYDEILYISLSFKLMDT